MLPPFPENLDKDQEEQYTAAWWNIFFLVIGSIKALLLVICVIFVFLLFDIQPTAFWKKKEINYTTKSTYVPIVDADDRIENGIHVSSGLKFDENFELVRANCTACHSGKLIAQNRATREGWQQMIRWMQATQNLWDLGSKEPKILDYLEKHYAPQEVGRRATIDVAEVEWYILNIE